MLRLKSIKHITKTVMLIYGFFILLITAGFFVNNYIEHKKELKKIEQDYIKSQKEYVKNETLRALNYIKYIYNKNPNNKDLIKNIVQVIEHNRDIKNRDGYVFIYDFNGVNIADPILNNKGKNLINFKDVNGKFVIKELIEVSKEPKGGFVEYVWNKPTTAKLTNKLSYAIAFKPLNWMIGSGVYLDDIEVVLAKKREEYKSKVLKYFIQILLFAAILFVISSALSKYFTSIIQKDIDYIQKNLQLVSHSYRELDLKKITFKGFKQIATFINSMISELKELNSNLENKVAQRTLELKNSKEQAEKLVVAQDKFIKNTIHEINTPLSIIITNIDLFKLKNGENRYITKIEAASKMIHNIYNDLVYLVKKDRIEYKKRDINFSKFLQYRVNFFKEIAKGNSLKLKYIIEKGIYIYFNDTKLQRVCDNTISNAIKYSHIDSTVEVKLYKEGGFIIFSVTNVGDSIKNLDKIFDRFYRENSAKGGFGLGLSIIKEICDEEGVEIELSNNGGLITFKYRFKNENIAS